MAVHLDGLRVRGTKVFHDVLLDPGKAYNLDHLVVAPSGVYNVDAKNWRGSLTVHQGRLWRHWYAGPKQGRQSEAMDKEIAKVGWMAGRASERLGHLVVPAIVLAGMESRGFQGVVVVRGVHVLSVDTVNSWIRNAPPVLDPGQVQALGELVRLTFPPAVVSRPSSGLGDAARTSGFLPPKAP